MNIDRITFTRTEKHNVHTSFTVTCNTEAMPSLFKLGYQLFFSSFLSLSLSGPEGQEVLLVTIPEFSSTQTACLVNLRTLECEPIRFSAFSADDDEENEMNVSH